MIRPLSGLKTSLRRHKSLVLVSLISFLYVFGNGAVWFVLPIKAENMLKNLTLVGLIIAVPNLISFFLDVTVGGYSDRVGRRKLMLVGLLIMGVLGLVLPSISSIPSFILFMMVFGLANQLIIIGGRAYVMDIAPRGSTSEYFGVQEAAVQLGFGLGPIIAGALIASEVTIGIQSTGLLSMLLCVLAIIVVLILKETVTVDKSSFIAVKNLIEKDKIILREILDFKQLKTAGLAILAITFVTITADGLIWTLEPLYANRGLDPSTVGLILSMFILPYVIFDIPAGYLADRYGKTKILMLGLTIAGVFLIIFGYSTTKLMFLASAFIATMGLSFARPSVEGLLTDLVEKKQKGGIVGIWNSSEDLGYILGPFIGGVIAESYGDITIPFILLGAAMLVLVAVSIPVFLISQRKSVTS